MGARRKHIQIAQPIQNAPRQDAGPVNTNLEGGLNQALAAQRLQLEAAFAADEVDVPRYPGALRLAIILGGSAGLWAIAASAVHLLLTH